MSNKEGQVDFVVEARVTNLLTQRRQLAHKRAIIDIRARQVDEQIILIDLEINRIVLGGEVQDAPPQPEMFEDTDTDSNLYFQCHEILLRQPMALNELTKAILGTGYKTKSKDFPKIIQQVIQRLIKAEALKKDEETKKYQAVAISSNTLHQRLAQQNKAKKRIRPERTSG